ncbi:uncharacterized protein LDX57_008002 [Aspergillus melleus]|uniref:uncharacterized protein n=1 Tax=Aspergillus melleus TaxID=138277 RepID=UPI001E8DFB74|nr:uncharacterized protein LDX57_008002 [Aspergillus melleus]KAH8430338.1 hypothetical protein LDX57_008002 [Aspergillus melleus]
MGYLERCHHVESQDEEDSRYRSWASMVIWCAVGYLCLIAIFVGVCFSRPSLLELGLLFRGTALPPFFAFSRVSGQFQKPRDVDIIALVPFHDHERTDILECYLQRNMAYHHGLLDQVIFVPQTNFPDSLEWLKSLVDETPLYSIWKPGDSLVSTHQGKEVLYIWIDGDMVFLEDHTIPTVVKTTLDHPDSTVVSANVINAAALQALHSHSGVALPYLPELVASATSLSQDWRVLRLPQWDGPANFSVLKDFLPPSDSHRWLLSSDDNADRTPISTSVYTDHGPGLDHWSVHAQQHYSFLHHLEAGDLYRYKFPMWKNPSEAVSQSFICFRAQEKNLLQEQERANIRLLQVAGEIRDTNQLIIDGKGLAVHYTMDTNSKGLEATDILHRYRAYAREKVCLDTA